MTKTFQIGPFSFAIVCPEGLSFPENFLKFQAPVTPEYTFTMEISDELPQPEQFIARRKDLLVFPTPGGEGRLLLIPVDGGITAAYQEITPDEARITFPEALIPFLTVDNLFVSLLALERHMHRHSCLILHCCYIRCDGEAILFSAPSGVGKSTQGGLWEQYRGAETINGDRCLLQKADGRWMACPWPVCGSSGICRLESAPVKAIAMLSQSPVDTVSRLSPFQAFSQLYPQITTNQWNAEAAEQTMALLEDLLETVPVYHQACTISQTAVDTLAAAIG